MAIILDMQGVLRADGTIQLNEAPSIPPGPVRVIVHSLSDLEKTPVWQVLEEIWAEQRASGHVPRTTEEIDADIEEGRQADEERMQAIERAHEECQAQRRESEEKRSSFSIPTS